LVTIYSFIFSLLIVISFYDIRHKIIPNKLVYVFIAVTFFSLFINYNGGGLFLDLPTLGRIIAGPLFALPFALIWLLSKGRFMGLGDAKLILGLAWIFVPLESFAILTLAFWVGSIISLILMLLSKKKMGMKTEIPFAPFLVISAFVVFFFSLNIFSLIDLFHF
jgi:leader peptidase (prepilin peptidase)/N-methyltransferase